MMTPATGMGGDPGQTPQQMSQAGGLSKLAPLLLAMAGAPAAGAGAEAGATASAAETAPSWSSTMGMGGPSAGAPSNYVMQPGAGVGTMEMGGGVGAANIPGAFSNNPSAFSQMMNNLYKNSAFGSKMEAIKGFQDNPLKSYLQLSSGSSGIPQLPSMKGSSNSGTTVYPKRMF